VSPSPQRKAKPRRIAFADFTLGSSLEHGDSVTKSEDGRGTTLEHGSYAINTDARSAPVTLEPKGDLILGPKLQRLNMTVGPSEKGRIVWTTTDKVLTTPERTVLLPQTMSFALDSELAVDYTATSRSITPREAFGVSEPQSLTPITVPVVRNLPELQDVLSCSYESINSQFDPNYLRQWRCQKPWHVLRPCRLSPRHAWYGLSHPVDIA
jgi:hypothetical protein